MGQTAKSYSVSRPKPITRNSRVHFTEAFHDISTTELKKIADLCSRIPYLPKPSNLEDNVIGINIDVSFSSGKAQYTVYYNCGGHYPHLVEFTQNQLEAAFIKRGI